MRALLQNLLQRSITTKYQLNLRPHLIASSHKPFSTKDNDKEPDWAQHFGSSEPNPSGWELDSSSWSTGLTKEHFDGEVIGRPVDFESDPVQVQDQKSVVAPVRNPYSDSMWTDDEIKKLKELEVANKRAKSFVDCWDNRMNETAMLMKQVREPGARGSALKESDKDEIYKKHKENPELYTVEKLAKDYRIMRQRVHAILFLKEDEEEQKKRGLELDDSVDLLIDTCPEFFVTNDREFHVATLRYKPDFKVMPEGWDGTTRDPDEVHYEISMKEDEMLYQEFQQRFSFNKQKMENKVKCHKYSRRRPSEGWNFMIEKLGPKGKRGDGGGWKFVSEADGSTRPLNEFEKMFVKRETPQRRRKILP